MLRATSSRVRASDRSTPARPPRSPGRTDARGPGAAPRGPGTVRVPVAASTTAALLLALGLGACHGPQPVHRGDGGDAGEGVPAAEWPFRPDTVRIHPLTRLVQPEQGPTHVEARIELLDLRGDVTKGVGRLEMGVLDERGAPDTRRAIDFWMSDLGDLAENAARFDPVTRTYLYRLQVPPEVFDLGAVLYVRYDAADGRSMVDRMELRTEP